MFLLVLRISNLMFLKCKLSMLITANTEMWKKKIKSPIVSDPHSSPLHEDSSWWKSDCKLITMNLGGVGEGTAERNWESTRRVHLVHCTPQKKHLKEWVRGSTLGISKMLKGDFKKIQYSKIRYFECYPLYKKLLGFPFEGKQT